MRSTSFYSAEKFIHVFCLIQIMHRKPGDIVTWQALNKCLFESDFDLEILTDLINDRQFPSYSKSSSLSDQDICEAKETFNNLFDWLIQSYSRQCFPPTRFCFMVEGIVRGKLYFYSLLMCFIFFRLIIISETVIIKPSY